MTQTLALTIGDPTGVGPEITVKLLADEAFCRPSRLLVLGDILHLEATARQLGLALPETDWVRYIPVPGHSPGELAYNAIETGVRLIDEGQADALVTGPISKANLHQAKLPHSGHTEILETLANRWWPAASSPHQADMLFTYGPYRTLLLTRHVPLAQVEGLLTVAGVVQSVGSALRFLRTHAKVETPRVAVLGVNPHAGEVGGTAEEAVLMPAIEQLSREYGAAIDLPRPADAFFRGFDPKNPPCDLVVAAYHDQGLIPMKLLAGMRAVNVTIGLPFLRTSVSHGMANDIAGKGLADETSLREAVATARRLLLARYTPVTLG